MTDPIIDEIRAVRHRISEECGHDPKRLAERYMKLQEEKYRDGLVRSDQSREKIHGGDAAASKGSQMPTSADQLLEYYDLEGYLFGIVRRRFHTKHSIGAFDFFSIIIWKANRAKSKVAKRLLARKAPRENDLDTIVRRLTSCLYRASDGRERLRVLIDDRRFSLPMASAVLTVFWPDEFTVYDARVCGELEDYRRLANRTNFDRLWQGFGQYVKAVNGAIEPRLPLRDKDRYLWARSAAKQLEDDIKSGFPGATD